MPPKQSHREIKLGDKKLIQSVDSSLIGDNFKTLTNIRYTDHGIRGVRGMTKINTTPPSTYLKVRSGIQFDKHQPAEHHLLAQAYNTGLTASQVIQHTSSVPATGDYSATSLWTDSAGAGLGRFSPAADGYVAYCNGVDSCIWGGNESPAGGFYVVDPGGTFKYDFTTQVQNTLTDANNIAKIYNVPSGIDSYTMLLLSLNNNVTDTSPTTAHTVTNTNGTFSTSTKKFGTRSLALNGTNAYLSVPDNADFSFASGAFTIDGWYYVSTMAATNSLFYQKTDISKISFITGTVEPAVGATINGQTSGATGIVDYVDLDTGTWTGGDAAGTIYFHTSTGTWQNSENIRVSTDVKAVSASVASDAGDNYIHLYISTTGTVKLVVHECYGAGSDVISLASPAIISVDNWYHIEVSENADDWYLYVDGTKQHQLDDVSRAKNYISAVYIGYNGTNFFSGFMDEIRVSNICRHTSSFLPSLYAYSSSSSGAYVYLASPRPIQGFKLYIGTANTAVSDMAAYYWNGSSYIAVSSLVDGTSDTGVSCAKTGSVSFTSTVGYARVKEYSSSVLYHYMLYFPAIDSTTTITNVTIDAPFQQIKDIWDGVERTPLSFIKYNNDKFRDYTLHVEKADFDEDIKSTYAKLTNLNAAPDSYIAVGFAERCCAIRFDMGAEAENTTSGVMTVYYWNGSAWTSVGDIQDGTNDRGVPLGKSGIVSWNAPDEILEFKTEVCKYVSLYYYKIEFSTQLTSGTEVRVDLCTGVPAQKLIRGFKFPVYAQGRLMLCANGDGKKNMVLPSAFQAPNVYNGKDSSELYFGDDTELTAGIEVFSVLGASLYNIVVFFKRNEMWAVTGQNPEEWKIYKVSDSIGCPAPLTLCLINAPVEFSPGMNRNLAIWQGADGIYISDGRSPIPVHLDIKNYFEREHDEKITTAMVESSIGFYDPIEMEYHWVFASGASATTLNKEMVLSLRSMKWFEIDRGSGNYLQYALHMKDRYGNGYNYGFIDTGYIERLEYGNSFDGTDIIFTMQTGDIALHDNSIWYETLLRNINLIMAAKSITTNDVSVTHYADGNAAGDTPWTMDPTRSGYRIQVDTKSHALGPSVFHSLKFTMTTNNELIGFEPLYLGLGYEVTRDAT